MKSLLVLPDDKEGFTRFSEIISLPCRLFYTVRLIEMPDTLIVIKNFLLLDLQPLKKETVFSFHADSCEHTIIFEKKPDQNKKKHNPKKRCFRVGTNILPDSIDNRFHSSNALISQAVPESQQTMEKGEKQKKEPFFLQKGFLFRVFYTRNAFLPG